MLLLNKEIKPNKNLRRIDSKPGENLPHFTKESDAYVRFGLELF